MYTHDQVKDPPFHINVSPERQAYHTHFSNKQLGFRRSWSLPELTSLHKTSITCTMSNIPSVPVTPAPLKTCRSRSFPPFQYSISPSYPVQRQLRPRYQPRNQQAFTSEATTTDSGLSFPEDSDNSQGQRCRYRSRNQLALLPLGVSKIESSHSFKNYPDNLPSPSSRARYPARRVCAPLKTTPINPLEDSNRPHPQRKRAVPPYETLTTVCSDGTVIKVTEC